MYEAGTRPAPLKRPYRAIISFMIFPYLSSTPPETQVFCLSGKSIRRPAVYRVHGPFYPSVVLTEPSCDGSLIMLWWIFALIRELSGSYRPAAALVFRTSSRSLLMWLLITGSYLMNVYSVVKVLCFRICCNNSVVTC